MYTHGSPTCIPCMYTTRTHTHINMGKYHKHINYALVYSNLPIKQMQKYNDILSLHIGLLVHLLESRQR